jgi:prepilin-type N-terminal cleavage/methylation domain-containing protein
VAERRWSIPETRCAANRRSAVTLIEVLLVISIIGLLAVLAWPNFDRARRSQMLVESSSRLRSLIAMCRAEAMNESRRYRISFLPDGRMVLRRQFDPVRAPHVYVPVRTDWAHLAFLMEDVWVESVALLPDGPAPIRIEDELEQFDELEDEFEPEPIDEFVDPIHIVFNADGTSDSLLWILRDTTGRGMEMILDGRLGRVATRWVERLDDRSVERPLEYDLEEFAQLEQELWDEVGYQEPEPEP